MTAAAAGVSSSAMSTVLVRLVGTLAGAALSVGFVALAAACTAPERPAPPPPPAPEKVDQELVDVALHDCFLGDCERAFAHLAQVSPTSPLRRSDAFRAVAYRYDADRLLGADIEPDPAKRRVTYQAVASSATTDPGLRLAASERIARLGVESLAAAREISVNGGSDAGAAAQEAADLLARSRSTDPVTQGVVRSRVEAKIFAGRATPADVAILRTVCTAQHDDACLHRLDHLILR